MTPSHCNSYQFFSQENSFSQQEEVSEKHLERLKEDFLNTISHELRTPLSGIKLATDLLEMKLERMNLFSTEDDCDSREEVTRYLNLIKSECSQEIDLIDKLIMLQQIESNNYELLYLPIDFNQWISEFVDDFNNGKESQIHIQFHPSNQDLNVFADLSALHKIIRELLDNAYKFTGSEGEITIFTDLLPDSVHLYIQNRGDEIDSNDISDVFKKFYRVPKADPWKYGGVGIGLSLAQKLAQLLGGDLWADSHQGITTMTLVLQRSEQRVSIDEYSVLESYVAYFVSLGKAIATPNETLNFEGTVYQYWGYHRDFLHFWHQLQQRNDFMELSLSGDIYSFGDFLNRHYTVQFCGKCMLPIPLPDARLYGLPPCSLCKHDDKHDDTEECSRTIRLNDTHEPVETNPNSDENFVIVISTLEKISKGLTQELKTNGFEVMFFSSVQDLLIALPNKPVGMIILDGLSSESEGIEITSQLRSCPAFFTVPIVALSPLAGYCIPWQDQPLTFKHYVLSPLAGKHLTHHLQQCIFRRRLNQQSDYIDLFWFPA